MSTTTITIAEGDTSGTATITVVDDTVNDDDETIVVNATSANPALTAASLTLTIVDNDNGPPTSLRLSAEADPAKGGDEVTVMATLNQPAPGNRTSVTLTIGGTATLGTDYTLEANTITVAEGETEGTATITVVNDAEDDDGETIMLGARSVNPALTAPIITLTIEDNDDLAGPGAGRAAGAAVDRESIAGRTIRRESAGSGSGNGPWS